MVVKIDEVLGLEEEQYRTAVILRSDLTALYATEDLALVKHKFSDYPDMVRSLYLVDVRQTLHFTQVFKILEIAGYEHAKKCGHISYELVTLPGNVVMSSREGTVVLLEDLLREATSRAREEARKKNPALTDEQLEQSQRPSGLARSSIPSWPARTPAWSPSTGSRHWISMGRPLPTSNMRMCDAIPSCGRRAACRFADFGFHYESGTR